MTDFRRLTDLYSNDLNERILPFWLNHSVDKQHGGYYNVIGLDKEIISTDKWIVWHCQQVIAFLKLYKNQANPLLLAYAKHGLDFIAKFTDSKNTCPAIVDRTGRVVQLDDTFYSEAYIANAVAQIHGFFPDQKYDVLAKKMITKIFKKREKQMANADLDTERKLKHLSELTAISQALLACQSLLNTKYFKEKAESLLNELICHFW